MGYFVLVTSGVAAGAAGLRHDRWKNINFHKWSKLDKKLCDTFIQIHCYWNIFIFAINLTNFQIKHSMVLNFLAKI